MANTHVTIAELYTELEWVLIITGVRSGKSAGEHSGGTDDLLVEHGPVDMVNVGRTQHHIMRIKLDETRRNREKSGHGLESFFRLGRSASGKESFAFMYDVGRLGRTTLINEGFVGLFADEKVSFDDWDSEIEPICRDSASQRNCNIFIHLLMMFFNKMQLELVSLCKQFLIFNILCIKDTKANCTLLRSPSLMIFFTITANINE